MYQISREFWFSAAHRIEGHPKCGRLHGHNYKVVVKITGLLDEHGMVLDFGYVDLIVKPLIDELDHRYLISQDNIHAEDPYGKIALNRNEGVALPIEHSTAEELAQYIHIQICRAAHLIPNKVSIIVQETPRNEALYEG